MKRIITIGNPSYSHSLIQAIMSSGAMIVCVKDPEPLQLPPLEVMDKFLDPPEDIQDIQDKGRCRFCGRFHYNGLTNHENKCRKRK